MREVKFRAWLKRRRTKIMCKVTMINFDLKSVYLLDHERGVELGWYDFNEIELLEYTNLKDKNGVEIYEGDVVESQLGIKYEVCFFEPSGAFGAITNYPYYDHKWFDDFSNMCVINNQETYKSLEVIGNIYENKELLNE